MKPIIRLLTCAVAAAMCTEAATAALNIPSDGSDGALVITTNTKIDLGQAVTGNWDLNNTANAGKGVYDPEKWAVVFKYSSVNISTGATVTFKNHASRAPVVWLVQGDVTIGGSVSVSGAGAGSPPWHAEPGPGGFRGGSGYYAPGAGPSGGFGPGGGPACYGGGGNFTYLYGSAGSFGALGMRGTVTYGNASLIPLIGGSGAYGSASANTQNYGGAAGGGAILICCQGTLTLAGGGIYANGGNGATFKPQNDGHYTAGGSGGGIRLVAETLAGNGVIQAIGGGPSQNAGGSGRVRIERCFYTGNLNISPSSMASVVTLPADATPQIWPPADGPSVRIVSVGGVSAPADPRAAFGAAGADVLLPQVTSTSVLIETINVETNSTLTVRVNPASDAPCSITPVTATALMPPVSENPLVVHWTASVPVKAGYSALQVRVVRRP